MVIEQLGDIQRHPVLAALPTDLPCLENGPCGIAHALLDASQATIFLAEGKIPADIAARLAADDCGTTAVLQQLDAIAVVPIVSWRYSDPGRLIAEALGVGLDDVISMDVCDWQFVDDPMPEPVSGGVLVKTLMLSLDPAMPCTRSANSLGLDA